MSIPRIIDNVIQYVSGAVSRIFGPSDDAYPNTGVQPFEGEPNRKTRSMD
ncbi:MAG: hypothetical protein HC866_26330 [Leptolyngbyaceae cyanobacterium RU_5_1]|nr:hypothetical protein [Leptolyngbyaceae cyanobacterium RU_5_1]